MAVSAGAGSRLNRTTDLINYNAAYTLMAWFNHINTNRGFWTLLGVRAGSSANQDIIYVDNSGIGYYLQSRTGGVTSLATDFTTPYGWNHIALRRNSTTSLDLVVNGVTKATLTPDVSARTVQTEMRVVDEFRNACLNFFAYNAALTNEQILDQMRFAYPRRTANLHSWLPLESGSARNVDFSGNGRNYTEIGTVNNADGLLLVRPSLMIPRRVVAPPVYYASPLMLSAC